MSVVGSVSSSVSSSVSQAVAVALTGGGGGVGTSLVFQAIHPTTRYHRIATLTQEPLDRPEQTGQGDRSRAGETDPL